MANVQRTPKQWQAIVEQHASSDLKIVTFCKQQKITPSSFYAWRKRLKRQSPFPVIDNTPVFTEPHHDNWVGINPEPIAEVSCWDIELSLPSGVVLRMMKP